MNKTVLYILVLVILCSYVYPSPFLSDSNEGPTNDKQAIQSLVGRESVLLTFNLSQGLSAGDNLTFEIATADNGQNLDIDDILNFTIVALNTSAQPNNTRGLYGNKEITGNWWNVTVNGFPGKNFSILLPRDMPADKYGLSMWCSGCTDDPIERAGVSQDRTSNTYPGLPLYQDFYIKVGSDVITTWFNDVYGTGTTYKFNFRAYGIPAAPATNAPTITLNSPTNKSYTNNQEVTFNLTFEDADTDNVDIRVGLINGTLLQDYLNQTVPVTINFTFIAPPGENLFRWFARVNDTTYTTNNTYEFTVDDTSPRINLQANSTVKADNSTIVSPYNYSLITFSANFTDNNLYAVQFNVTYASNNSEMWNYTEEGGITGTTYGVSNTINISGWTVGEYKLMIQASDQHTTKEIKEYDYEVKSKGFKYDTEEGNLIEIAYLPDENWLLEFFGIDNVDELFTVKEKDRYSYEFKFKEERDYYQFKVTSDNKIIYIEDSDYNAHFIVYSGGVNGNWIDFNEKDLVKANYAVEKINDYEYIITISDTNKKKFKFDSIGGLNFNENHYRFEVGAVVDLWAQSLYDQTELNFTVTYGDQAASGTPISAAHLFNITTYVTSLRFNATNYGFQNHTINISQKYLNISINLSPVNTMVIYFYDEYSNSLITGETFSVFWENSLTSDTFTTTTNPHLELGLVPDSYNVKAYSTNYPARDYLGAVVSTTATTIINFYLMNTTLGTEVTFTIKDNSNNNLDNVLMDYKRAVSGSYITVNKEYTDFAGQTKLYMDSNYDYRILLSKDGYNNKTIGLEPSNTAYTIYLDKAGVITTPLEEMFDVMNIYYNLNYTNSTKIVLFEWNDTSNMVNNFCLNITDGNSTISGQCSSSNNSSLTYTITNIDKSYIAYALATVGTRTYVLDTYDINLMTGHQMFGKDSIIFTWIITITLGFIGLFQPVASLALMAGGLGVNYMFGIIPIGRSMLFGLIFIIILCMVGISKAKRVG